MPSQFTDSMKLGGVADTPEGCAALHRDLDRMERWSGYFSPEGICPQQHGKWSELYSVPLIRHGIYEAG